MVSSDVHHHYASVASGANMKVLNTNDVRAWYAEAADLAEFTRGIGYHHREANELGQFVDLPLHLQFTIEQLAHGKLGPLSPRVLDSISFYSLCRGLFLPLSGLSGERVGQIFGIVWQPSGEPLETLVRRF